MSPLIQPSTSCPVFIPREFPVTHLIHLYISFLLGILLIHRLWTTFGVNYNSWWTCFRKRSRAHCIGTFLLRGFFSDYRGPSPYRVYWHYRTWWFTKLQLIKTLFWKYLQILTWFRFSLMILFNPELWGRNLPQISHFMASLHPFNLLYCSEYFRNSWNSFTLDSFSRSKTMSLYHRSY